MRPAHLIWIPALLLLVGCFSPENQYGRVWDSAKRTQTVLDVIVPPNAPSQSNIYFRVTGPDEKEHLGIDLIGPRGIPVIAPADGRVIQVYTDPFYGKQVVIDQGRDADGNRIRTHFKHMDSQTVTVGDTVTRGQQIGTLGNTGALSGGLVHLHYEVLQEMRYGRFDQVDPNLFWVDGPGNVTCFDPARDWPAGPFRATYPVVCR